MYQKLRHSWTVEVRKVAEIKGIQTFNNPYSKPNPHQYNYQTLPLYNPFTQPILCNEIHISNSYLYRDTLCVCVYVYMCAITTVVASM